MAQLSDISTGQLRRAVEIKEQIDALNIELNDILGGAAIGVGKRGPGRPKLGRPPGKGGSRIFSAASKAKMAAAQKARWAKIKGEAGAEEVPAKNGRKGKRKMSAAGRAAISAAAKARWAAKRGGAAPAAVVKAAPKKKRKASPALLAALARARAARAAKAKAAK